MKNGVKAFVGLISSTLGGGLLAMFTWAAFSKPEASGVGGVSLQQLNGMSFKEWCSAVTGICTVAGLVIAFLLYLSDP